MKPAIRQLLMQPSRLPPYLGQVATHAFAPALFNATHKQMMTRTRHVCKAHVPSVQLAFASWQGSEAVSGANATITASVEYPVGTFTQALFSGVAGGTITDGSYIISDVVNVSIPKGATFFVRSYYTNTAGICYNAFGCNTAAGEGATFAPAGVVDQTMGGTITPTAAGPGQGPIAILGMTTEPSFCLIGDSKCAGTGETFSGTASDVGELARSFGDTTYAYMNLGIGGATAQALAVAGAAAKRAVLGNFCSHVVSQFGINDLVAARTSAQLLADVQTIRGLFRGKAFVQATVAPKTSSTDAWATTVNQTPDASNAQRIAFNSLVRATPIGHAGYVEIADQIESARDSGLWKAGFTADGIHENQTAYVFIQNSVSVSPTALARGR